MLSSMFFQFDSPRVAVGVAAVAPLYSVQLCELAVAPYLLLGFGLAPKAIRLLVTWPTQRQSVVHVKSKFWKLGKSFDVVSLNILIGSTLLASMVVSRQNRLPPPDTFSRVTKPMNLCRLPATPVVLVSSNSLDPSSTRLRSKPRTLTIPEHGTGLTVSRATSFGRFNLPLLNASHPPVIPTGGARH